MKHRAHDHDSEKERWPTISIVDQRKRQTQLDRPFGSASWRPLGCEDSDNGRLAPAIIAVRDRERDLAESEGRDWLGIGSRQYAYRLKSAGFMFADATKLDKKHFARVGRIVDRLRRDRVIATSIGAMSLTVAASMTSRSHFKTTSSDSRRCLSGLLA